MKRLTFLLVLSFSLLACTHKDATEEKIERLLHQMTIEEKIGQMNQLDPTWLAEEKEEQIKAGMVGSVFNVVGAKEVNRLQRLAVENTRLGIPLVFARDVIHGFKTIYPIPIGQSATWDTALVAYAASLTAKETTAAGVRWAFSPMVDVTRDARWGRLAEGYGEDTYLTSQMGAATVRGYQRANDEYAMPVAACVKHFAGYGVSESGRDYNTTWIPQTQLRDVYLPTFKAAIDAGSASIMCSFNDLNGLPSSANRWLNVDLLRDEWQYDGLLVSDWGSCSDLVPHKLAKDKEDATLRSINARIEMDMQGNVYTDYLKKLLQEGKIKESQLDDCVRSVLRLKFRLGLFDNPYVSEDNENFYSPKALAAAQKAVEQGAILLKNDGILPLLNNKNRQKDIKTILICGPLANQKKEQLGTWVFDGEPEHSITPLEAFVQHKEINVIFEEGLTFSRDKNTDFSRLISKATNADAILFFCGEEAILSGEARCRADINLPGAQQQMMQALAGTGKPVVMIVMAGRPLTIGHEVEKAAAVVYSFHGGTMAGEGLYNVLTGAVVPSGKLPMTVPQLVGQVPIYYNHHNTGRPAYNPPMLIDDIPIGCPQFSIGQSSYHLEVGTEPLYPFGYGLSYTTFAYSEPTVEVTDDSIKACCTITNTGKYDGAEVAQLYVHQKSGDLVRPLRELKGFQKHYLKAGESKTVSFAISKQQLAYWHEIQDHQQSRVYLDIDKDADFCLWIAPDSKSGTAVDFRL